MRPHVTVFTGAYGSGKTEVAINFALVLAARHRSGSVQAGSASGVVLVDLDIVNPFFRSRDKRDILERRGVRVVSGALPVDQADLPAISPEVRRVFDGGAGEAVLDVGGDRAGATALGSFADRLARCDYEVNLVVNAMRPFTSDVTGMVNAAQSIQEASRLPLTGIVSNTHFGRHTDPSHILRGHQLASRVADLLGVPVRFVCVAAGPWEGPAVRELEKVGATVFRMTLFMRPPWEEGEPDPSAVAGS